MHNKTAELGSGAAVAAAMPGVAVLPKLVRHTL
jgi:hypothetical protein